jgi:hypothetical protein
MNSKTITDDDNNNNSNSTLVSPLTATYGIDEAKHKECMEKVINDLQLGVLF